MADHEATEGDLLGDPVWVGSGAWTRSCCWMDFSLRRARGSALTRGRQASRALRETVVMLVDFPGVNTMRWLSAEPGNRLATS